MYKTVVIDNKVIHMEGYESIICLSDTQIKIKCKKTIVEINGENLVIDGFNGINIKIKGLINDIRWLK